MKYFAVLIVLTLSVGCTRSQPPATPSADTAPSTLESTPAPQPTQPSYFFGLNIVNHPDAFPTLVHFSSYRWWDNQAQAVNVHPAPGKFDWAETDEIIANLVKEGVYDGLYELGRPPAWMHSSLGVGTDQAWRDWVATAALHFNDPAATVSGRYHISGWSVWNEFSNPGSGWTGTNAQLLRMSEDARCIITGRGAITDTKETCADVLKTVKDAKGNPLTAPIDPSSKVGSPSFGIAPYGWQSYFTLTARQAADFIEFHSYCKTAQDCLTQFDTIQKEFPHHEIWVGEVSWQQGLNLTDQQKADFMTELYTKAKVARMYDYAYNSSLNGTLELGGKLTLAGQAYQALSSGPQH